MKKYLIFIFAISFVGVLIPSVQAQRVTRDNPNYDDMVRLEVCQKILSSFVHDATVTENDLAQKLKNIKSGQCSALDFDDTIRKLTNRVAQGQPQNGKSYRFKPVRSVNRDIRHVAGGFSAYPSNGRGFIDADINGVTENRQGVILGEGQQFDSKIVSTFNSKHFHFTLAPEMSMLFYDLHDRRDVRFTVSQGYGVVAGEQQRLLLGRFPMERGAGLHGGPIFTDNARAQDMVMFSTDDDNRLPFFLKKLGRYKVSVFAGNKGPETYFPWSFLAGSSYSLKPTQRLELNLTHAMEFGGEGSPDMGIGLMAREFFGFIPEVSQTQQRGANKVTSMGIIFDWPEFMAMRAFADYSMDDANTSSWQGIKKHFTHNSSYRVGSDWWCFMNSCKSKVGWDISWTSPIAYRHSSYREGWTSNGDILGDPLGSNGFRIKTHWKQNWNDIYSTQFLYSYTTRDSKVFWVDGPEVRVTNPGTPEVRQLWAMIHGLDFKKWSFQFEANYEFIQNHSFTRGNNESGVLVGTHISRRF